MRTQSRSTVQRSNSRFVRQRNLLHDIVRTRVYVPDPNDVAAVAGVLKRRLGFTAPANTTVCAPLAVPEARVEIEVEALRGSGTPAET